MQVHLAGPQPLAMKQVAAGVRAEQELKDLKFHLLKVERGVLAKLPALLARLLFTVQAAVAAHLVALMGAQEDQAAAFTTAEVVQVTVGLTRAVPQLRALPTVAAAGVAVIPAVPQAPAAPAS
jgi:hypothetical protein